MPYNIKTLNHNCTKSTIISSLQHHSPQTTLPILMHHITLQEIMNLQRNIYPAAHRTMEKTNENQKAN